MEFLAPRWGASAETGGPSSSDIIVEVDRTPVATATNVAAAVDSKELRKSTRFRVLRQRLDRDELVDLDIEVAAVEPHSSGGDTG